jgi:hypothetical protein
MLYINLAVDTTLLYQLAPPAVTEVESFMKYVLQHSVASTLEHHDSPYPAWLSVYHGLPTRLFDVVRSRDNKPCSLATAGSELRAVLARDYLRGSSQADRSRRGMPSTTRLVDVSVLRCGG